MNRKVSIFSAVIVASLISGSLAYATTVASSKVTACADKTTGVLRAATRCKSSEKAVPLISGSVQLAPIYTDVNKKPINVLSANFDSLGQPFWMNAIVNGKYVNVDGLTGKVYPVGSNKYTYVGNWPFYYLQSDCSGAPFLWLSNSDDTDVHDTYANLSTNKNYAGYFIITVNNADSSYKISDVPTAYSPGTPLYQKSPFDGACRQNTIVNNGDGYAVSGFTTIALQAYSGARIPDFRGPISVAAQ